MKHYLIIMFCSLIITQTFSQTLTASGGWGVSAAGQIYEAGQNYNNNLTSSTAQTLIDLVPANSTNWEVKINRQDIDWTPDLQIWVRRTGDGTGAGAITGTSNFFFLPTNLNDFFSGSENRNSVPIQYEIRGLSVLTPVKNYSTYIIFTLMDM